MAVGTSDGMMQAQMPAVLHCRGRVQSLATGRAARATVPAVQLAAAAHPGAAGDPDRRRPGTHDADRATAGSSLTGHAIRRTS